MKKIFLVFLAFLPLPVMISAQVFVNSSTMYSSGTILMPEKYVDYLKTAKTYFIVPESMSEQADELTVILKKVWTFNEIEAISLSEANNVPAGKNAFFNITGYIGEDVMYILMQMTINIPKGNPVFKKEGEQIFAGFYLATDVGNYAELLKLYRKNGSNQTMFRFTSNNTAQQDYINFYYSKTQYHNFHWGQISNYLAIINNALLDATIRPRGAWGLMKVADPEEIKNLKTATLYVPDYMLNTQKMVMGSISSVNTSKEELMADYKYTYKMMSSSDLSDLILTSTDPVYYVDFISTNLSSFLIIFNSKTHQAAYARLLNGTIPTAKTFKDICAKIDSEPKQGPPSPFKK